MNRNVLILDDDDARHRYYLRRYSHDNVRGVYTREAARESLYVVKFDVLQLDIDLDTRHKDYDFEQHSGLAFARDLARFERIIPRVIIHSWNPWGARQAYDLLKARGADVTYEPYYKTLSFEADAFRAHLVSEAFPEGYPPP